jgi:hypothetical protein
VTHPNLDPQSFLYKGASINTWTQTSSLATLVKAVHDDFTSSPPIPLSVVGGTMQEQTMPARPQYVPETFSLSRVDLSDLKGQVKQMPP